MDNKWIANITATKSDQKIGKIEQQSKSDYRMSIKTTIETANFCSNICHSTLKLDKKIHTVKRLAFLLRFLFRRDQNHVFDLASNIVKISEQILETDSAPMQFKFF